jgi:hypothetical protein
MFNHILFQQTLSFFNDTMSGGYSALAETIVLLSKY